MGREIKFRAWVEDDMVFQYPMTFSTGIMKDDFQPLIQCKDGNRAYTHDIIEQFTGLKDKNGVDIYEGDIFKLGAEKQLFEVRFESGCFLAFRNGKQFGILAELLMIFVKVIGNIHQNHELL